MIYVILSIIIVLLICVLAFLGLVYKRQEEIQHMIFKLMEDKWNEVFQDEE